MTWRWHLLWLFFPVITATQGNSPGASACVQCHSQARTQPNTSMGRALETVKECRVLIDHPVLTTKQGRFSYRIERKGDQSIYSVTDGLQRLELPIRWVMGASSAIGQTYVLEKDGNFYESRVSYYRELKGLDLTMGAESSAPTDLTEAAGRLMGTDDKLRCFGCHATNAVSGRHLTLDKMTPGVQCEHCHEGTETHLAAMLLNSLELSTMNDAKYSSRTPALSAERVSNFCGQCHRTWEEIAIQGRLDITNIRFQPYRLTGSKCYDADDPRISCLACHDPHHEVSSNPVDYDAKCQTCHGGGKAGAKTCPVSTNKCSTCHMPKLELPGAHYKFSDHRIRVVKANEKYPG